MQNDQNSEYMRKGEFYFIEVITQLKKDLEKKEDC